MPHSRHNTMRHVDSYTKGVGLVIQPGKQEMIVNRSRKVDSLVRL
jgi:hypothetical protein